MAVWDLMMRRGNGATSLWAKAPFGLNVNIDVLINLLVTDPLWTKIKNDGTCSDPRIFRMPAQSL